MFRLILLILIQAVLVDGFTTTKKSFSRPEHLRYANLEKSYLFTTGHDGAARRVQEDRIRDRNQQSLQQQRRITARLPGQEEHALQKRQQKPKKEPTCTKIRTPHPVQHVPCLNNRHASKDWLYNLKSLPRSSVLKEIKNPVLTLAGWATAISIFQRIFSLSANPTLQAAARNMCVPHSAHSFLVSSLGLLLVFRTNSAYQRFMEGRKIWENILSVSRNLSRMITLYENDVGRERVARIKSLLAAYPYLLRHHIRSGCLCKDSDGGEEEDGWVDDEYKFVLKEPSTRVIDTRYEGDKSSGGAWVPNTVPTRACWVDRRELPWCLLDQGSTLDHVAKSRNRPLWVCDRIGREIMDVRYNPNYTSRERLSLLGSVDKLTNAVGECERIHQTAVPLNYARHALRSLTLWLFTLPFSLVKDLGLLTGPVTAIIAWLLFGVYQIGHSIEDPFQGSLRLSMLCDAIRRDILTDSDDYSTRRQTAFEMENEDEDYDDIWEGDDCENYLFPSSTKARQDVEKVLSHAPKLVKENGTWTVVGA